MMEIVYKIMLLILYFYLWRIVEKKIIGRTSIKLLNNILYQIFYKGWGLLAFILFIVFI